MQFRRTPSIPQLSHYSEYRSYLRSDFKRHCAYCTGHEDEYGGEDHFEIDHFRPKGQFSRLEHDYSNLYYCCHGCNKNGAKGSQWPSPELFNLNYRFFDPVAEEADGLHFKETTNGRLKPLTNVGLYSIEKLRLNREGLIELRQRRRSIAVLLSKELKRLERRIVKMQKRGHRPSAAIVSRLDSLKTALKNAPVLGLLPGWWHDSAS